MAVSLLLLAHGARYLDLPFVDRLDGMVYDTWLRLPAPGGRDDRVAILDIDEKSLAEVGRWPWGRDRLATLVAKLLDRQGAMLVAFDMVFAEPDDSSGLASLEALARHELKDDSRFQSALKELRPRLDHDRNFAAAIAGRPVVLGYYFASRGEGTNFGTLPPAILPAGSFPGGSAKPMSWDSYGANLESFQAKAVAAGHFNPILDPDGVLRRVPMLAEYRGRYYESLSLAVIRTLLGLPPVVPGFGEEGLLAGRRPGGLEWLELPAKAGAVRIPVDAEAAALVPFRGPQGSFAYVSAADVLADRLPPGSLRDRIVLVGTTAPGLMDLRATPFGRAYAGVEVHANLIAGMLDGNLKHTPAYGLGAYVLLLAATAGVMVFLLPLLAPTRAAVLSLGLLAALVAINLGLWQSGLVLPLAGAVILVLVLFAFNMFWGYFVESRGRRQLTSRFGQYLPPELVAEMARDPERYGMACRREELTVLFADIRGFTSLAQDMAPDQLAALMNEYFGAMTEVVRRHRGTLDKYIGDAVMAFWGAPMATADHAGEALRCALEMQAALPELNRRLVARGWPALQIGIGINTGAMAVGDMGSPLRRAYTVLGDAVNLGSRIEGLTKRYGVGIIVGENTRDRLKDGFVFQELDRVRVQGKEEPVAIYEPLGEVGQVPEARLEALRLWQAMLRHYRAGDWDQAELALMNLDRLAPRRLYEAFRGRIARCRATPPEPGWDGVWNFESK